MARGEASIYLDGPWSHRSVSANGTRFHIAESGDGPLVLLLHGFPQFWWTWRRQLSTLSEAGFRANAVVVGHDWGAMIAWSMAAYFPKVVRRLGVVSAAHPLRLRAAVLADPFGQGRSSRYALGFQMPMLPERQLLRDHAERVGELLESWSGPGW